MAFLTTVETLVRRHLNATDTTASYLDSIALATPWAVALLVGTRSFSMLIDLELSLVVVDGPVRCEHRLVLALLNGV
jgi:hypothetical protein